MIVTLLLAVVSGFLYRAGGMGDCGRKAFPKLPGWFFTSKVRDWGCPAIALVWMILFDFFANVWVHAISFLLFWGALCTYWDRLFKYDNFYMHGLMCGLAYLGYAVSGDVFWGLIVGRSVAMACLMGVICDWSDHDFVEEFSRGFVLIITLPILGGL